MAKISDSRAPWITASSPQKEIPKPLPDDTIWPPWSQAGWVCAVCRRKRHTDENEQGGRTEERPEGGREVDFAVSPAHPGPEKEGSGGESDGGRETPQSIGVQATECWNENEEQEIEGLLEELAAVRLEKSEAEERVTALESEVGRLELLAQQQEERIR